jgi:hypothetical protein
MANKLNLMKKIIFFVIATSIAAAIIFVVVRKVRHDHVEAHDFYASWYRKDFTLYAYMITNGNEDKLFWSYFIADSFDYFLQEKYIKKFHGDLPDVDRAIRDIYRYQGKDKDGTPRPVNPYSLEHVKQRRDGTIKLPFDMSPESDWFLKDKTPEECKEYVEEFKQFLEVKNSELTLQQMTRLNPQANQ